MFSVVLHVLHRVVRYFS